MSARQPTYESACRWVLEGGLWARLFYLHGSISGMASDTLALQRCGWQQRGMVRLLDVGVQDLTCVRNEIYISDMFSLPASVESFAQSQPEGTVLTAKSLLHLGNRAAVDQALSRLARQGRLVRVGRGAYVALVKGKYGTRLPEPSRVVSSLAEALGEVVVPHAAASANRLGLSLQVPGSPIFLTSGRSRKLRLGKLEVELRHGAPRHIKMGSGLVAETIRALEWLGPQLGPAQVPRVMARMQAEHREQMLGARSVMPTWLAAEVSRQVGHG